MATLAPGRLALRLVRGRRAAPILWGFTALGCAAALIALELRPGSRGAASEASTAAPVRPFRFAPDQVDIEQIRRAGETIDAISAYGGLSAVRTVAESCSASVEEDPTQLDHCLALRRRAAALAARAGEDPGELSSAAAALKIAKAALPPQANAAERVDAAALITWSLFPEPRARTAEPPAAATPPVRTAATVRARERPEREPRTRERRRAARSSDKLYPPPWPYVARAAPASEMPPY